MMQGIQTLPNYKETADYLATFGREGDTYIVHAEQGETVIPLQVLDANPKMKKMLFKQMEEMGLDPQQYIVGNELNSINPVTGQPEFFLKKLFGKLKDVAKKIAPIVLPIAMPYLLPTMPLAFSSGIGSFAGSMIGGAKPKDALKNAVISGGVAGLGSMARGKGFLGSKEAVLGGGGITGEGGMTDKAKGFYSENISPSRFGTDIDRVQDVQSKYMQAYELNPDLPISGQLDEIQKIKYNKDISTALKDPSLMKQYGPLLGIGAGGALLADALTKEEEEEYVPITGADLLEMEPEKYGFGENFYGDNPYYNSPIYQVARGGAINGPGTGTSDSIPAMLSDGEFVLTANAVKGAGGGDRKKGAAKMYQMMKQLESKVA
jgi:hypothetical protein